MINVFLAKIVAARVAATRSPITPIAEDAARVVRQEPRVVRVFVVVAFAACNVLQAKDVAMVSARI
jgi:hypothetical protein